MKNDIFSSIFFLKVFRRKNDIFHDFFKVVLHIIEGHPRYVESHWGPEKPFQASNHVYNAFRQNIGHIWSQLKFMKIAILVKNSSFDSSAGSVRVHDIWPEMETWGVVDAFCTRNRCLNPSRSIFKWFWNFAFFDFLICGFLPNSGR